MKKNAVKKVMAVLAAATMMMTALPVSAQAATWKEGTNKVTANLNIPASSNPVKVWDAYFTNTAVPPRKAVKNNATVTKVDGKVTLEIPVNNSKFCIYANQDLSIATKGLKHLTDQGITSLICDNNSEHSGNRYSYIYYDLTSVDADSVKTVDAYVSAKSHAAVSLPTFNVSLNDSIQTTPVHVVFDLSNAIE